MHQRLDYRLASPEAFKALLHVEQQIHRSGLEASLLGRIKTRASQINGWNRMTVAFRTAVGGSASPRAATR